MYRIIAYKDQNDNVGTTVFDPRFGISISEGKLTLKQNEIDDLTLTVNLDNPLYGKVIPFKTLVEVYDDETLLFFGRALKSTHEMKESGQFVQTFIFESCMSYLIDSIQRFREIHNTSVEAFFRQMIGWHNDQVPMYKKFNVRNVTVTNSTDNVYRYLNYDTTWDTIKDKLLGRLGGYLKYEHQDGINWISYVASAGAAHTDREPIKIAVNMKSANMQIDPTSVITRLIPLGKTLDDEESNSAAFPRLDISTVNNGHDYIDIPELQSAFGMINGTVVWDDIGTREGLLAAAKKWIATQSAALESWSVGVLELPVFNSLRVGDSYIFMNEDVATTQRLTIAQKQIDFLDPTASTISVADKPVSLSQYQLETNAATQRANQLQSRVDAQQQIIGKLNANNDNMQQTVNSLGDTVLGVKSEVDGAGLPAMQTSINALTTFRDNQGARNEQQTQKNDEFEQRIKALEGGSNSGGD